MLQIYFTGREAWTAADGLYHALQAQYAGFTLHSAMTEGVELKLLRIHGSHVPERLQEIPVSVAVGGEQVPVEAGLTAAEHQLRLGRLSGLPLLLCGLNSALLLHPSFCRTVQDCLCGEALCVSAVAPDAVEQVRGLSPVTDQCWIPAEQAGMAIATAIHDARMRLLP